MDLWHISGIRHFLNRENYAFYLEKNRDQETQQSHEIPLILTTILARGIYYSHKM
jgi:hypothetical protein